MWVWGGGCGLWGGGCGCEEGVGVGRRVWVCGGGCVCGEVCVGVWVLGGGCRCGEVGVMDWGLLCVWRPPPYRAGLDMCVAVHF